jgi:hypothetical protein
MRPTNNPDFITSSNNGVVTFRPGENGRFSDMCLTVNSDPKTPRVWVFCTAGTHTNKDGDEITDHQRRGISVGTNDDWREYKKMLKSMGISVQHDGGFVPFSNGPGVWGTSRGGKPMADYARRELRMARFDLPTKVQLEAIIAS